jgi:DNA-binding transcriptional LysR family regulator
MATKRRVLSLFKNHPSMGAKQIIKTDKPRVVNMSHMDWDDIKFFLEVARTERLSEAAKHLNVDASTVSRRLYKLERTLNAQLFERSTEGHILTEHGQVLFEAAQQMDLQVQLTSEILQGQNLKERGNVRLGSTEAFGSFFLAPNLASFSLENPNITVELLPLPRFLKLTKLEADLTISIERPPHTSLIVSKLCDYRLKMYATREYLEQAPHIAQLDDLREHPLISYVRNLVWSKELNYLDSILPNITPRFSSTSVVAQYMATLKGLGPSILPCFLARHSADLVPILENDIDIVRSFWLIAHPERKRLARVNRVWGYLKDITANNSKMLMGK